MYPMDFANTPASLVLLCVIVGFSALALWIAPALQARHLLRPYWMIKQRDYIPLVSSGFIHGDVAHLLFNSLTFFFFGPPLEMTIGTPKFIALYFIALLLTGAGTMYRQRKNPDYAALGASGAILAVLFAFIVYYPTTMLYLFFAIPIPAVVFAFGYMAYSWWASKNSRGRIAHDAHLDGALTGLIFVGLTDFDAWARAVHKVFG
jgi:membrane associated rhomboid family serine protease